jgi:hypothetical protein
MENREPQKSRKNQQPELARKQLMDLEAVQVSSGEKAIYWLVDVFVPNLITKFGRDEFEGKLLIASRQLWNLISENEELKDDERVRTAFIGPGYVKGIIKKGTGGIEFGQTVCSVIFDPRELRRNEPVPLVNIFSPEVIDPSAESSKEEIESVVRKTMITRGNPLVQEKLAEVRPLTSVPTLEYTSTAEEKLEIRMTSGLAKARFALKGIHKKIYAPYSSMLSGSKHLYDDFSRLSILWVDKRQLVAPSREKLSEWAIVEQSSERAEPGEKPRDGYDRIVAEYRRTLDFMKTHSSSYILT